MSRRRASHHAAFNYKDLYIALEQVDMDWLRDQVAEFIRLWEEEYHLEQIANYFKREKLEVIILYLDLVNKRKIKPRLVFTYAE